MNYTEQELANYHIAKLMVTLESLKAKGVVSGGFIVANQKTHEFVRECEEKGYPEPTKEQLQMCVAALREEEERILKQRAESS